MAAEPLGHLRLKAPDCREDAGRSTYLSEQAVSVPGLYAFYIVLDDVPVLSQLAVLQPVDVADLVDMAVLQRALEEDVHHVVLAVQPDELDLRAQGQEALDEFQEACLPVGAGGVVLDIVVPHEPVNVAGISPAEDLVVKFLHQGFVGCRLAFGHHEPPLSACT